MKGLIFLGVCVLVIIFIKFIKSRARNSSVHEMRLHIYTYTLNRLGCKTVIWGTEEMLFLCQKGADPAEVAVQFCIQHFVLTMHKTDNPVAWIELAVHASDIVIELDELAKDELIDESFSDFTRDIFGRHIHYLLEPEVRENDSFCEQFHQTIKNNTSVFKYIIAPWEGAITWADKVVSGVAENRRHPHNAEYH